MTSSVDTAAARSGNTSKSPPRRSFWYRWRYRLSGLLLIIPLLSLPSYFDRLELNRGAKGLGEREIGEYVVGPWSVRLAEWRLQEPFLDGDAGYLKTFSLAVCPTCVDEVKAAYVRVGKPRSLRAAGGLFFGTPYRQLANLPIPDRTTVDSEIWITLEGWDGSVHQVAVPLGEASPVTLAWLKRRGRDS